MSGTTTELRLPKDGLLRANFARGVELRADGGGADGPVMAGYFAVFNEWTEIKSYYEGNFLERFVKGAFSKTIRDNRDWMRVLFQHGFDPTIGDKPLGPIDELREEDEGVYYEVPLLDAGYVRDEILPGLEAELYGASFRFRVIREEIDEEPGVSDYNPQGLPERTVKEAQVPEFGPVTFPAYDGASAGVRSMRPRDLVDGLARDPQRHLPPDEQGGDDITSTGDTDQAEQAGTDESAETEAEQTEVSEENAPPDTSAEAEPHPDDGRRAKKVPLRGAAGKTKTSRWRL